MDSRRIHALVIVAALSCIPPPYQYVENRVPPQPVTRVFEAPPDAVWEATVRVFDEWPVSELDPERGTLATDWLYGPSLLYLREEKTEAARDARTRYVLGFFLAELIPETWAVLWVVDDGPAARAGITPMDVVWECNDEPVFILEDIRLASEKGDPVSLLVLRGDSTLTVEIQPEKQVQRFVMRPLVLRYAIDVQMRPRNEGAGTEVRITSSQEADFSHFYGGRSTDAYRRVPSSSYREAYLLTLIGLELGAGDAPEESDPAP